MRAVGKRAGALTAQYRTKARNVDRVFGGVPEGQVGPVQAKLMDFGKVEVLVFGAFCEASEGLHKLAEAVAEARVRLVLLNVGKDGRRGGVTAFAGAKAVAVGQVRRWLFTAVSRAQARLLLDRMAQVGAGGREAAARRLRQRDKGRLQEREAEAQRAAVFSRRQFQKGFFRRH